MGIKLGDKGDQEGAHKSFEAAVKFNRNAYGLTNLGVTVLNYKQDLKTAEKFFLEAWSISKSYEEQHFVEDQLDVLEQHLAFARGAEITGDPSDADKYKYRRRAIFGKVAYKKPKGAADASVGSSQPPSMKLPVKSPVEIGSSGDSCKKICAGPCMDQNKVHDAECTECKTCVDSIPTPPASKHPCILSGVCKMSCQSDTSLNHPACIECKKCVEGGNTWDFDKGTNTLNQGKPTKWNFQDPEADHTDAAIKFIGKKDVMNAKYAFEAATKFDRQPNSLVNLGLFHLNEKQDLRNAEKVMLEAWAMATEYNDETLLKLVNDNLDMLEEHLKYARGEYKEGHNQPQKEEYRRRAVDGIESGSKKKEDRIGNDYAGDHRRADNSKKKGFSDAMEQKAPEDASEATRRRRRRSKKKTSVDEFDAATGAPATGAPSANVKDGTYSIQDHPCINSDEMCPKACQNVKAMKEDSNCQGCRDCFDKYGAPKMPVTGDPATGAPATGATATGATATGAPATGAPSGNVKDGIYSMQDHPCINSDEICPKACEKVKVMKEDSNCQRCRDCFDKYGPVLPPGGTESAEFPKGKNGEHPCDADTICPQRCRSEEGINLPGCGDCGSCVSKHGTPPERSDHPCEDMTVCPLKCRGSAGQNSPDCSECRECVQKNGVPGENVAGGVDATRRRRRRSKKTGSDEL